MITLVHYLCFDFLPGELPISLQALFAVDLHVEKQIHDDKILISYSTCNMSKIDITICSKICVTLYLIRENKRYFIYT